LGLKAVAPFAGTDSLVASFTIDDGADVDRTLFHNDARVPHGTPFFNNDNIEEDDRNDKTEGGSSSALTTSNTRVLRKKRRASTNLEVCLNFFQFEFVLSLGFDHI